MWHRKGTGCMRQETHGGEESDSGISYHVPCESRVPWMVDNWGHSSSSEALMQPLKALLRWSLLSAQERCVSLSQALPEPGYLSASARMSVLWDLGGSAPHVQMEKRPDNWLS